MTPLASVSQSQQLSLSPEEIYRRAFEDIQVFAALAMPGVFEYRFPALYVSIWEMLVKASVSQDLKRVQEIIRFALGLPRGFAKTTFIKLIVAWLIVYDLANFILIICATEPLAENFLSDVDEMLASPQMEQVYGFWTINKAIDNKQLKKANYRKHSVIIAALGAGSSLRGLNIQHQRPDVLICDDMQTKENDDSDAERERLFRWFVQTLLKCINPRFCLVLFIGNMYSTLCILYKLKESPHWISLITGCILADGTSLWEELHPLNRLFESFKHDESLGQAALWMAEMMNDPMALKTALLPSGSIPDCPFSSEYIEQPTGGFITIDPAGFRKISDDNVLCAYYIVETKPIVVKMDGGLWNPRETIKNAFEMAISLNIPVIAVETTAYQQSLKFWIEYFAKELGIDWLHVVEISPKGRAKESRIRSWIQQVLAGEIYVYDKEARAKLVWQAVQYKIGKADNKDDWLDAAAYGEDVKQDYWDLVMSFNLREPKQLAFVVTNNTPF